MLSTVLRPIFGSLLLAFVALSSPASAQLSRAPVPRPQSQQVFPPVLCTQALSTTGCTTGSVTTTTPVEVSFPSPTANFPAQCATAGYAPFDWCTAGITQACDGSADGCDPGLLQATTLDLPKFNPGTCQKLIRAKLRLDLDVINEICVENLNPGPTPIQYSQSIVACIQAPFALVTPPSVSISVPQGPFPPLPAPALTGFDGVNDFSGASGECIQNNQTTFTEFCFDDPTELANFTGVGNISFKHRGVARTLFNGPGNFDTRVRTCGRVRATITYTYCCCITTPNVTASACAGGPAVDICLPITSCTNCTITCANVTLGTPTLGTVTTSPSCQVACPAPGCCVRYTPPAATGGVDTFTYTVNVPGCPPITGTVTVNVCRLTAPNVTANTCSTNTVDICLPITASAQCGTISCSNVTFSSVTGGGTVAVSPSCGVSCPAPGCCVRYNPAGSTLNTVTFTYTVTSPLVANCAATGTVTVNICRLTAPNVSANVCSDGTVDICLPITSTTACGTITCANVALSTVTGGGSVAVSPSCGVTCPAPGCCVRYNAAGSTGNTATFTYTVTAPGVPSCTAQGTVTVNICRLTAPPVCIDVCSGTTGKTCLPYTFSPACGAVTCANVTLGAPLVGTLAFGNCTGITGCTTGCCIDYTAPPGLPFTTFTVPYTVNDNAAGLTCARTGDITIRIYPAPTANDDLAELFLPPPPSLPINVLANDDPGSPCGFGVLSIVGSTTLIQNNVVQGTLTVDNSTTPSRIVFTPAPTFNLIEGDQICFTYKITNACPVTCPAAPIPLNAPCFDTAQVCIRVRIPCAVENRLECGSLLLFPEYDNRAANRTLVTITDGCCLNSQTGTTIEVVFIDKATCEESNRTFQLSACDTLSFLTSFVNLNTTQGYLYAFARNNTPAPNNPLGSPIVFNHLIGQEVILDGITSFEYAINGISFKGYGAEGALNDDDGDGIRDLNELHGVGLPPSVNPEYSAVPDRILVPRFLGQANPGESRLILIGLSGGRLFETTVAIEGYNDNEVPFSASYTFRCWDKPLLTQLSGAFLQSSMKTAGDDPDEIVGRNSREAGWFWIDGDFARSTAETIDDPAVYAVLVERSGGQYSADLPFEFCGQGNGDLLPTGLFGDGPNPTNGDNQ